MVCQAGYKAGICTEFEVYNVLPHLYKTLCWQQRKRTTIMVNELEELLNETLINLKKARAYNALTAIILLVLLPAWLLILYWLFSHY